MYSNFYSCPVPVCSVKISEIPTVDSSEIWDVVSDALNNSSVSPFACFVSGNRKFYVVLIDYAAKEYKIIASSINGNSFNSSQIEAMYQYEREIYERNGIVFKGHPYLKPLKRPCDSSLTFEFDSFDSTALHEVNVGPVHAGIIEPGKFRFVCWGETIKSLEISLGYQRRGIEKLIITSSSFLRRMLLSEQITGDSVIANSLAMATLFEGKSQDNRLLNLERTLSLELERIAMHLCDISALSGDCAYQIGQVAAQPLRTVIINSLQLWSGSRFGRGLIRPFGSNCRLTLELLEQVAMNIEKVKKNFIPLSSNLLSSPSLLLRLDDKCLLSRRDAARFGIRGPVAKASGLCRDIRSYVKPVVISKGGDLLSRLRIRLLEVEQSIDVSLSILKEIKSMWFEKDSLPDYNFKLPSESLLISAVEGFRGTIGHVALTDEQGNMSDYRIFDPSLPAWPVLGYVMKNQQISDFPLCNKSFNLSYLASDL